MAAVPLPAPRSVLMGPEGVGVRPAGSLAPDCIRGQAGGPASRKRRRRPVAVEPAIGASGREPPGGLPRPGWKPRPGGRAVDPLSSRGQDSGAAQRRPIPPSGGHMGAEPKAARGLPHRSWRMRRGSGPPVDVAIGRKGSLAITTVDVRSRTQRRPSGSKR